MIPNPITIPSPQSPLCMRRGAQGRTEQGERLSERNGFELDPGWTEHRRQVIGVRHRYLRTNGVGFRYLSPNGGANSESGVLGSEYKFPAPSAVPGVLRFATQRNCDPTPKTKGLHLLTPASIHRKTIKQTVSTSRPQSLHPAATRRMRHVPRLHGRGLVQADAVMVTDGS